MNNYEFFILLLENPGIYGISLILALTIFYCIFKRARTSLLNPLAFNFFSYMIGGAVLFFLTLIGSVSIDAAIYVVASGMIFWSIVFGFQCKYKSITNIKFQGENRVRSIMFFIAYFLFILFNLATYMFLGIPLLNEQSRLVTYAGSGLGFLERLQPALISYVLFYIFLKIDQHPKKIHYYAYLIPFIIFGILSGSRSAFLQICFAFWGFKYFYQGTEISLIKYIGLIWTLLAVTTTSFFIQNQADIYLSIINIAQRISAAGDIYWQSLPNQNFTYLVQDNPIISILYGFLGPLRLIDQSNVDRPLGFQINEIVNPTLLDVNAGPLSTFSIYGLAAFGVGGGLIFTFIQALFAGLLLRFFRRTTSSLIISSALYTMFNSSTALLADLSYGLGSLFSAICSVALLFCIFMLGKVLFGLKTIRINVSS